MVTVASPVPGADEEDAVPGAADTGNIGETAMGSATSSGPVADEEDAAPGAGEDLAPGLLAPPPLLLRPRVAG